MLNPPNLSKPVFEVFPNSADRVTFGVCVTCPNSIEEDDFRDDLSKKEYGISGMCQECQDDIFGGDDPC